MAKYKFASLRGSDFVIEGDTPQDAWNKLCEREKDNGSLWKTQDLFRNKNAVQKNKYKYLNSKDPNSPAYIEVK